MLKKSFDTLGGYNYLLGNNIAIKFWKPMARAYIFFVVVILKKILLYKFPIIANLVQMRILNSGQTLTLYTISDL